MSQLVRIKNFQFIAMKDKIDITDDDRKKFANMTVSDFQSNVVDVPTSIALLNEFDKCPYSENDFRNDFNTPYHMDNDKYIYIYPEYAIGNQDIPVSLQSAGIQIIREPRVVYIAPTNNPDYPYTVVTKDGKPFESEESSERGRATKLDIHIHENILALSYDDYMRYMNIQSVVDKHGDILQQPVQDLYLWSIVKDFAEVHERIDVIWHELKHAKNKLIKYDIMFDNPDFQLNPIEIFRCEIKDEISAKIAEVVAALNTYNQSPDKNDFSMFDQSYILRELLFAKGFSERAQLVSDIKSLVPQICEYWYKTFFHGYMPQFMHNVDAALKQMPLKNLSDISDGKTYNEMSKKMFNFNVYNPQTKQYVNMDLSPYIAEYPLAYDTQKIVQQMYIDEINQRNKILDKGKNLVQNDLIAIAHNELNECVLNTEYRRKLNDLENMGLDYLSALDFTPNMNMDTPTEKVDVQPHQTITEPDKRNIFQRARDKIISKITRNKYAERDTDNDYM